SLGPIGATPQGYQRSSWSAADVACREWFAEEAADRGLTVETDGNGNMWAWHGDPAAGDAVVTGSHFDSVPGGGGYDGALGITSAFLALDVLSDHGVRPRRPIGIVAFTEEEGARFGVACLGSRLLTGARDPAHAEARRHDAVATVGRVSVEPNATNAIPSSVTAWLDARAADQSTLDGLVAAVGARATEWAGRDGTGVTMTAESVSPVTEFHVELRDRIAGLLGGAPVLPTGAGHDAGVRAAHVRTAGPFVRNPT